MQYQILQLILLPVPFLVRNDVNIVVKCKNKPSEYIVLEYMYLYVPGSFHVKSTNGQKVDASEFT